MRICIVLDGHRSLASVDWPDLLVIRSVTKTFGLAGLRAGYLLGPVDLLDRLRAGRRPWAVSTPALAALTARNPQGRLIAPAEVTGAALWLASDAAASVNGQAIVLDGGESA